MAPRKRNRSTLDSHRFRSDTAQITYIDTFKYRPIVVERGIELRDFPVIEPLFNNFGWSEYASFSGTEGPFHGCAIGELVREFFANMHAVDMSVGVLHSYVRSVNIELTPNVIAQYLHIPRPEYIDFEPVLDTGGPSVQTIARILTEGRVDWVGETIPHRQLSEINRMIHLYVVNSIDPTFHVTAVSERRGRIIHSIVTGRVFDLPLFMFRLIATGCDSTSRSDSMPFGMFLTHYLLSLGVEVPKNYQLIKMPNSIDHVSARRSRTHSRPAPVPPPIPPQPSDPRPSVSASGPSTSTPPVYDMDMLGAMLASIQGENRTFQDNIYQRFSAIDARQAEFHTLQTGMDTRLRAMQTRQDEMHLTLTQVQQNLNTSFPFGDPFGDDFFPPGQDDGGGAHDDEGDGGDDDGAH